MNNFLLTIAGCLVLILCALFAVPPLIDWNNYRGTFEEEVSRLLDREVRVRGSVNVRLLPVPYVSFEKVSIADVPGVPGSFAQADRFKMWLSVPPLLRGVVEARQIELEKPTVRLSIDENGQGNWQQFDIKSRAGIFLPADVVLNSLLISDGTVIVATASGDEITRLSKISGEVTAEAIDGPYKFKGDVALAATPHATRFSTSKPDAEGRVRFIATAQGPQNRTTHKLDGTLIHAETGFRVAGALTSRGSYAALGGGGAAKRQSYELGAKLDVDKGALKLKDIAVAFNNDGRPQSLKGSAVTAWSSGVVTRATLSSQWLDLDAIAGRSPKTPPWVVIGALLENGLVPVGAGEAQLQLRVDQANLGGESISRINTKLIHRGGVTKIERLRAAMPGRTALAIEGYVAQRPEGLQLDGHIVARGASLGQLAKWARTELIGMDALTVGAFTLAGPLRLRGTSFELTDASGRIEGLPVSGSVAYDWSKKPFLNADLDVDTLDLAKFGKDLLDPQTVGRFFGVGTKAGATRKGLDVADLSVRLRAKQLTDGQRTLEDIDVDVTRIENALKITRLNVGWASGLKLRASGNLKDIASRPVGALGGTLQVSGRTALADFRRLVAPATGALPAGLLAGKLPLNAAFDAILSDGKKTPSKLVLDGTVGDDRLRLDATSNGRFENWADQDLQLNASVEGRDAAATARRLFGRQPAGGFGADRGSRVTPAYIALSSVGVPNKVMKTYLRFDGGDFVDAQFRGDSHLARREDNGAPSLNWAGRIALKRGDGQRIARTFLPFLAGTAGGVKLTGDLAVARANGITTVQAENLTIDRRPLRGALKFAALKSGDTKISGSLNLAQLALPAFADLILKSSNAPAASGSAENFWTDRAFDFARLATYQIDVAIQTPRLMIQPGLEARDARWQLAYDGKQAEVRDFAGKLRGGALSGKIALTRSLAGVRSSVQLRGEALSVPQFAPALAKNARASGKISFNVDLAGLALSPRALASTLKGKGSVTLRGVRLPGLPADQLTELTRSIIAGELEPGPLAETLTQFARTNSVKVADGRVNVQVADGSLLLSVFSAGERLRNRTTFDLSRMLIDSEWIVQPARQPAPAAPDTFIELPAVRLVYGGPVSALAQIKPTVQASDLQRELVVRRMERNVAELERLRREDEARAKAEAERRQRIEEERRRSLEEERRRREEARLRQEAQQRRTQDEARRQREEARAKAEAEQRQLNGEARRGDAETRPEPTAAAPGQSPTAATQPSQPVPPGTAYSGTLTPLPNSSAAARAAAQEARRARRRRAYRRRNQEVRKRFNPFSTTD